MSHFGPPDSIQRRAGRPLSRGGGLARFSEPATWAGRPFTQGGLEQCRGVSSLRGSHSLKGAEEGKAGRPPGRERPSAALERGKKGLSTLSEVPSVTPARGRGSWKGRGVSAPLPPLQGKSGSREAFLAPWEGLLRAPWLPERPSSPQRPREGGNQRFQYPRSRSMLK